MTETELAAAARAREWVRRASRSVDEALAALDQADIAYISAEELVGAKHRLTEALRFL